MSKKPDKDHIRLELKGDPKEGLKLLGGGRMDEWNNRLNNLVVGALPIAALRDKEQTTEAALAVSYGTMDIAPADPIEGVLIAQLMAANEASLAMYRRGWAQPPEHFEVRTKYLQHKRDGPGEGDAEAVDLGVSSALGQSGLSEERKN